MNSEKIEQLLQEMNLEEKVSMLSGASIWYTAAVERLGIPAIKVTDGPNGAREPVIIKSWSGLPHRIFGFKPVSL
ncbi:MAG TPA: hypothetical protein VJZ27_15835 [Aggregatilineales bacterium]|nr:hypothetical protein [Aggregatilineales bacterium]